MVKNMFKEQIKTAFISLIVLTIITGVIYPFLVTGLAQVFFPQQAKGSLIYRETGPVGSTLIGQQFDDPKYFWGRLSATSPLSFNAASSSGSNLGPSNPALLDKIKERIKALKEYSPDNVISIPVDLVTASASGLDPHISKASADYQIERIARLRGLSQDTVRVIVEQYMRGRFLGLIGEPVVNVLEINLALDSIKINSKNKK